MRSSIYMILGFYLGIISAIDKPESSVWSWILYAFIPLIISAIFGIVCEGHGKNNKQNNQ